MDEIEAEIVNVSQEDKKIGLSIRKLKENSRGDFHRSYVNNQEKATSNLGELLKEKMMNGKYQASLETQESDLQEGAESGSDTQIGEDDTSSARPQSGEVNSA